MIYSLILALALLFAPPAWGACVVNAVSAASTVVTGSLTLNAPAGAAVDDIWIASIASANGDTFGAVDWTVIHNNLTGFANLGFSSWWFRYAGTTPNLIITGATDDAVGTIVQLRGCDTVGSPLDGVGAQTNTANSDTVTILGITPATSNTLLITVVVSSDNMPSVATPPSGFAADFFGTSGGLVTLSIHNKAHVSGATGNFSQVFATQGGDDEISSRMFAIEQAATAAVIETMGIGGEL